LDTSVLVAVFRRNHVHHERSLQRFVEARQEHSTCAIHSLAEFYATLSALPDKPTLPPEQVFLFIQEIHQRLSPIVLDAEEYLQTIQRTSESGLTSDLTSGKIYDALLLACAAKSKAQVIYTWNLKHFHSIAPHLAHLIQNP
jgi:predicted nucleic acid-binding protein